MKRRGGKPIYIYAFILSLSSISNLYGELFPDINGILLPLYKVSLAYKHSKCSTIRERRVGFSFNNQFDEHLRGYDTFTLNR